MFGVCPAGEPLVSAVPVLGSVSSSLSRSLQQASLAATAPLSAFQPPPSPAKGWRENGVAAGVADGVAANGVAASTQAVPVLRASLSEWTQWLEEEVRRVGVGVRVRSRCSRRSGRG